MLNSLIKSIKENLKNRFGQDYQIYSEPTEQDLQKPCFFVQLTNSSSTQQTGQRHSRENRISIQYIPKSQNSPKQEMYDILDRLYTEMEYIEHDGGLLRGTQMQGEPAKDKLYFIINYNMIVKRDVETQTMEYLKKSVRTSR